MNILRSLLSSLAPSPHGGQVAPRAQRFISDPRTPMLMLNDYGDALYPPDFYEGIHVFGATGSGKSSGSGQACLLAMLQAGWGGLILCAKPDEAHRVIRYLHQCGRGDDLIHMRPGSGVNFNFIEHEFRRPDGLGRDVFNLVSLLMVIVEAARVALGMPAQDGDGAFWIAAMRELLTNVIEPLVAATGRFRFDEMMRFINSAPTNPDDMLSEAWRERSYFFWAMRQAHDAPLGPPMDATSMQATTDYWFGNYARLDNKTRSNIVATLTSSISPLLRGVLHETFCTDTTVIPEMTHQGAVIVLDYPIKTVGPAGVMAGQIMKYKCQRSAESRPITPETRPTFVYADESHLFASTYDPPFQSTARSSMAATVYLSQNLPTYYALQPGRDPKASADALLGNFQTKIFHANTDSTTNQYAADLIGKRLQARASGNWSSNEGWSEGRNEGRSSTYQRGKSEGSSWGSSSNGSVTYSDQGNVSYTVGGGSNRGGQEGTNSSWSGGRNSGTSSGVSGGFSRGGGWSEQMDYLVPPDAFASQLRKGGPSNDFMVDGIVVQGGRRFEQTGSNWLHCVFQQ